MLAKALPKAHIKIKEDAGQGAMGAQRCATTNNYTVGATFRAASTAAPSTRP